MKHIKTQFDAHSPARSLAARLCRNALRRSLVTCSLAGLLALGLLTGTTAPAQQYAGVGCTATMENRSALIDADGTFSLPNVPVVPGQYQIHIVCPQADGSLLDAYSPYYNLSAGAYESIPLLPLGAPTAQPVGLQLVVSSGQLTAVGSTVQLATLMEYANGAILDASHYIDGTTYISSNTAVATVNTDGLVTATGAGSLTITANNNGLISTIQISSFAALDSDGDGMPDAWEIANGLNPYDPTDAALDPDGDGLTNLQEYQLGTNPHVADTDGDGLTDGQEVALGTNPLVADTDGDGLSDGQEVALGTNPLLADTDGDGIPDGIEVKIGTNPLVPDITTVVTGYVTNADGTPSVGTSTVVLTYFNALTDSTGKFTIPTVPITLGNLIATAEAVINTKVYSGSSQSTVAVGNGVTNVGTIVLGQNSGQVSGTVLTPDNKPDVGAQVVVTSGADTRTAVTDGNGLYAVSGLSAGNVMAAAIDPATSLRGQATGVLGGSAPLTLNIQLTSFGTVAGNVTDVNGNPVPADVGVTISGSLNANTQTDGAGHYSFPFVPLGAVTVDAVDTNGNHGRTKATITATNETIVANVQYLGQGTVSGLITDSLGNPSPGATVNLLNTGVISQNLSATANSVGQYSFSNVFIGTVNLTAQSAQSSITGNATAAVLSNNQAVTANITLQPSAPLSGIVYRADGATPVANATVTLNGTGLMATTSAAGGYSFAGVPLGTYNVLAADTSSPDMGQVSVNLPTADQAVSLNINMAGLGSLVITVVDAAANLSSGAAVVVNTGAPYNQQLTGVTATNGTVTINQVLAVPSLAITATNPATDLSGNAQASLSAGQTLPVTVTLQASGTLSGTVYQVDGQTPVPGISVQIAGGPQTITAANGTYSFSNLATGSYNIGVYDSVGNELSSSSDVSLSSQGQVITANFIIVGRGTVSGNVTFTNGSSAPGVAVQVTSNTSGLSIPYGTATDTNGNYSISNVPVGSYTVTAQQHTLTSNSYGSGSGSLSGNGTSAITNVVLSSSVVPSAISYQDANGFQYSVRQNGGIFNGSFSVFGGDGNANEGASLLSLVQNGQITPFAGEDLAPVDLNGREISYTQAGLDGLTVTRRVYVPIDGYFARYIELLSNPGASPVTVDVQLTTNFGLAANAIVDNNTYILSSSVPQIIATSSGDQVLNINDPNNPDHWITLGGAADRDPFLPDAGHLNYIPTIADVFDGPGAALTPTAAIYNNSAGSNYSQLTETYGSVTVPAGGTVGIMHFLSQENLYESSAAAAARLVQLPPEALAGIATSDLPSIQNFAIPSGGTSTLSALATITNQATGNVYEYDGVTPVPNATVYFTSSDPIYARFYSTSADANGYFNFQGALGGIPVPNENFSALAWDPTNTTLQTATCRQAGLFQGLGCAIISPPTTGSFTSGAQSASANVTFTNTGILTGTISRGPTVLNAAGTVTLSGGPMNTVSVPINADGTYTFLNVYPGSYNLIATVTNTLLTGIATSTVAAGQTTTTNITIIEAGTVTGSVTRPDSSLAIGDTVNLRISGQQPLVSTVDTSGHYAFTDVPIGAFEVDCYDSISNTAASATGTVANGVTLTENLALQSAGTVTGSVTVNDGSSVSGLTVTLVGTTSTGTQSLSVTTNNSGVFTFDNVMPGTLALHATNPEGLQGSVNGSLPIAGQTVNYNIALIAAGNLQGTVYQADGVTPAAGIQVTVSPAPLNGSPSTTTSSAGQYSFTAIPLGPFTVTATNTTNGDQGSASSQIQANNQQRTVNVNLNGFGNLNVTVLSPSGNPVPDAAVTLTTYSIASTHTLNTNASGIAPFTSIFAGSFSVSAKDPVSGYSTQTSGTITYNQTTAATLTLQALGTIQGTVYQPDGVTPQAGATVIISGIANNTQVTTASGTYQFANIPTGYYYFTVQDANGNTRASASNVQLQGSNTVLIQNFTFIGIGTVSGIVSNADGSVAENVAVTVTTQNVQNAVQGTTTAGDGSYSFNGVPVGKVTVAVDNLPSGEIGYGNGTVTNGQNTIINVQIQGNGVTLPLTLNDADGYSYVINANGTLGGSTSSYLASGPGSLIPFFNAAPLTISVAGVSQGFATSNGGESGSAAIQSLSGQQIELTAPVNGLNVTRKLYVPSNGYFMRRLDVLQNPTSAPITATVNIGSGSYDRIVRNGAIYIVTNSNGNTTIDNTMLWLIDNDDNGSHPYPMTQPAVAEVFKGANAPTALATATNSITSYTGGTCCAGGNTLYSIADEDQTYTWAPVIVPANGQVSFLYFTSQEASNGTAITAAQRLEQLPPEALSGITSTDLSSIVNFVVPATQTLQPVSPPLGGGIAGQVVAGDNVTPVPNATVYIQSTDLQYGSGIATTADSNGNYSVPFLLADTYAAEAVDPVTSTQSVPATGTLPSGGTSQNQNIPFTGTGIMRGQLQTTGQTPIYNGSVYASFYCSASNGAYCGSAGANTGTSGAWTFLTEPAGSAGISVSVYTTAAGGFYLTQNGISIPAGISTYVSIPVPATGNISGVVTNADGTPAIGVTVSAYASTNNGTTESTTTASDGSYSFIGVGLDTYTVSAADPITSTTISQTTTISQDTTSTVNLQFVGHGTVNLAVKYANGNIATNVTVYLYIGSEATTVNNYASCQRDPAGHCVFAYATTDSNGNASIANVPDGAFQVHAYYPGWNFFSNTVSSMAGNGQTVALSVSLTPVGTVSGQLTTANGTAVPNAYVNIVDASGTFNTNAQTDSAGNFAFSPVPADQTVTLTSTEYANGSTIPKTITATLANQQVPGDSQTLTVTLRFPGLATVAVNLLNADGSAYKSDGSINIALRSTSSGVQNYTNTFYSNPNTFTNVVEDSLVAYAYDYNTSGFPLGSTTFTLGAADDGTTRTVNVTIQPSGTIQGAVYAADGTTQIQSNYYIQASDAITGVNINAGPTLPPGYQFTSVSSSIGGLTLTPYYDTYENGYTPYTSLAVNAAITTQGQTITQNFTLPLSVVSGTVYLNDGVTPDPNANVSAQLTIDGSVSNYNATADANGNYQIVGTGTGVLVLTASDSNGVTGALTINIPTQTSVLTGQNILLGPTGTVVGTVFDTNGNPQPNTNITVTSFSPSGSGIEIDATTDNNGNYLVTDVPLGNPVNVNVTLSGGANEQGTGALTAEGQVVAIVVGTPPPGDEIFGTVYDSNQNPATGATVTATAQSTGAILNAVTDANGMYTITGVALDTYSVTAVLSDGVTNAGTTVGTISDLNTPVEIDIGLMNYNNVSGNITDANGNPVVGINVNVFSTGDTSSSYSTSTDGNGNYYIGFSVAPGMVTVQALDSNNNVLASNTGQLPYGGNVVINVQLPASTGQTSKAQAVAPVALLPFASGGNISATQRAIAAARITHATSLDRAPSRTIAEIHHAAPVKSASAHPPQHPSSTNAPKRPPAPPQSTTRLQAGATR